MRENPDLELSICLGIIEADSLDIIPQDFSSEHFSDFRAKKYAVEIEKAKAVKQPPQVYLLSSAETEVRNNYLNDCDNQRILKSVAHVSSYGSIIENYNVRCEIQKQELRIEKLKNHLEPIPQELKYDSDFMDCVYEPERLASESHKEWKRITPTKFRFKSES